MTYHTYLFLQVHRLVIVDDHEVVKGIVSLSDILQALVLTNADSGKTATTHFKVYLNHSLSCGSISEMFIILYKIFP